MTVPVALIAAVARNGIIGSGGHMPWRLRSDFAFFRRQTMGKPLVMGRVTLESIGKPLPGRTTIVVSRRPGYQPDGVIVIDDLAAALDHAQSIATADGASEVMVAGGGQIYRAAMPMADRLYITHVDLDPEGDVTFPTIDPALWTEAEELNVPRTGNDTATFRTVRYERQR